MFNIWPVGNFPESIVTGKNIGLNTSLSNFMQLPRSTVVFIQLIILIIDKIMILNINRLLIRTPCSPSFFKHPCYICL